jgi:nucleoid DNA-binding protein
MSNKFMSVKHFMFYIERANMKDNKVNINKRSFWRFVNIQINRTIHHYHVFSVINILFDEILKDLKDGKTIEIDNFCTIKLIVFEPKRYFDVVTKTIKVSSKFKALKFYLNAKLQKKLSDNVDMCNTG